MDGRLPSEPNDDSSTRLSAGDVGGAIHLPSLWRALRRSRGWIIGVPLVMAALVGLWTWFQTPQYEGRASMLIETQGGGGGGGLLAQQVAALTGLGGGRSTLETDLQLLQSRQVIGGVVDSLALRVLPVETGDVARGDLFRTVEADSSGFSARIVLTGEGEGRYALSVADAPPLPTEPPASVRVGEPFRIGGVLLELARLPVGEAPERIELEVVSRRRMLKLFRDELVVERPGGNLVELRVRYPDAQLAAAAANRLVERFIHYRQDTQRDDAVGSIAFLQDQVATSATDLRDAEERLREFREQEQLVSAPEQAARSVQRLSALDAQRAELAAQRTVLARLIESATAAAGDARTSEFRRLAAFPEFFRNPAVQDILQSLVELGNQRAEVMVLRTESNVDVRALTDRIQELERQLLTTARDYLAGLDEQLSAIDTTLRGTTGEAARVPAVETEFMRLSREVERLNEIHTLLQMRLKEQEVAAADRRTDVRLVDAALVPVRPASPRPLLNLLLALVVGGMIGVGIAVARASFDRAMYSREVVAAVSGGLPILTSIPAGPAAAAALPGQGVRRRLPFGRTAVAGGAPGVLAAPGSAAAEAYATLRTRLANFVVPPPRTILVASPRAGDGKSTVAANLAAACVRGGSRVVLVEADLRRGGLARILRLPAPEVALASVLDGSADWRAAITPADLPGGGSVDVLLAGRSGAYPTTLLESAQMERLVEELRSAYDVVVIDTPPLDPVSDALLVARHADGALLVARAGVTRRDELEAALDELDRSGARVHGLVLNGFEPAEGPYRYQSAG